MLKILQARIQQYMNGELPDVQAGFRKVISLQLIKINEKKKKRKERKEKTEEPAIKLPTSIGS